MFGDALNSVTSIYGIRSLIGFMKLFGNFPIAKGMAENELFHKQLGTGNGYRSRYACLQPFQDGADMDFERHSLIWGMTGRNDGDKSGLVCKNYG